MNDYIIEQISKVLNELLDDGYIYGGEIRIKTSNEDILKITAGCKIDKENIQKVSHHDDIHNDGFRRKRKRFCTYTSDSDNDNDNDDNIPSLPPSPPPSPSSSILSKKRKRIHEKHISGKDTKSVRLDEVVGSFPTLLKSANDIIAKHFVSLNPVVEHVDISTEELVYRCWSLNKTSSNNKRIVKRVCDSTICILLSLLSEDVFHSINLSKEERLEMLEKRETGKRLKQLLTISQWSILLCPNFSVRSVERMNHRTFHDLVQQLNYSCIFDEYIFTDQARDKIIALLDIGWDDYDLAKTVVYRIQQYI